MEIADLTKFLVIARSENLQKSRRRTGYDPSALSKSLKRLENTLDLLLFDRVGKTLRLNDQGKMLQPRAAEIVVLAQNTRQLLGSDSNAINCRIAAPAILQYRWASVLSREIRSAISDPTLTFVTVFEQAALAQLKQGDVQLAIVTDAMLTKLPIGIEFIELGQLTMQIAAGRTHPLVNDTSQEPPTTSVSVTSTELSQHSFATPYISPFCGEARGLGCDGWQDQLLPRKTNWIINDYAVLSQLVRSGQAIAYLPDFLLREWQLTRLEISDNPHQCVEKVLLLFHAKGPSWVAQLVNGMG